MKELKLKLYLISQSVNNNYDTYSDAVVCAEDANKAREINPSGFYICHEGNWFFQYSDGTQEKGNDNLWCDISDVIVKEIGIANDDIKPGSVICASFNAG